MEKKQILVPIHRIKGERHEDIDFFGTGTLMTWNGLHILASAAHVISSGKPANLLLGGLDDPIEFNGSALVSTSEKRDHKDDPIDFGVIILADEQTVNIEKQFAFLDVKALTPIIPQNRAFNCFLAGYPCDINAPLLANGSLANQLYRIGARADLNLLRHSQTERHKKTPADYIAVRYDPRKMVPNRLSPSLKRPKKFNGLSGGAIRRR